MANKMDEQTPKTYYRIGQELVHPDDVSKIVKSFYYYYLPYSYAAEDREMAKKKGKGKGKGC